MDTVSPTKFSTQLTDITGLRFSGVFPSGREPSIRTLGELTKLRRMPHQRVGHFAYYRLLAMERARADEWGTRYGLGFRFCRRIFVRGSVKPGEGVTNYRDKIPLTGIPDTLDSRQMGFPIKIRSLLRSNAQRLTQAICMAAHIFCAPAQDATDLSLRTAARSRKLLLGAPILGAGRLEFWQNFRERLHIRRCNYA